MACTHIDGENKSNESCISTIVATKYYLSVRTNKIEEPVLSVLPYTVHKPLLGPGHTIQGLDGTFCWTELGPQVEIPPLLSFRAGINGDDAWQGRGNIQPAGPSDAPLFSSRL